MKIPTNKKKTLTKDRRLIFISEGNKLSPLRINGGRQSYRTNESAGNLYSVWPLRITEVPGVTQSKHPLLLN